MFTHRPLFDLKPEWEWFTSDGDDVMNALAPYENVTVLYGHIHRENFHQAGTTKMYAARSLIFAFPDPAMTPVKKPMPFDKAHPFKDLGIRRVNGKADGSDLQIEEVELATAEFSGTVGMDQMLKHGSTDTDIPPTKPPTSLSRPTALAASRSSATTTAAPATATSR